MFTIYVADSATRDVHLWQWVEGKMANEVGIVHEWWVACGFPNNQNQTSKISQFDPGSKDLFSD